MEDTIAAISTAYGEGGIGIIRISGSDSLNILEKIFSHGKSPIVDRMMTYGHIVDLNNKIIDEVLCVYMKGPKTYTTEDIVEINCHGSIVSLRNVLELVISNGAKMAEPGEFTKRAFLNGRLDLTQAEAVIDLIKAKSDATFDVALEQLDGSFSKKIKKIRKLLLDVLVDITVNIDYPDEDIELIVYEKLDNELEKVENLIFNLLKSADTGRMIREGLKVSIIGKPNVGKSSLLNSLLKEARAIVTEIPGTTRDIIEEYISVKGIPVILTDTAGIRDTEDLIEKIGIEKSKDAFNKADLIIFMIDLSRKLDKEDYDIINLIDEKEAIILLNKADLEVKVDLNELKNLLPYAKFIETSLINDKGIEEIENAIIKLVYGGKVKQESSALITNVRHENILKEARLSISDALNMVKLGEALDFIEVDVNNCYSLLGEIIGETVKEDIINEVFSRFCLGK